MNKEILKLARECSVPDTSRTPAGELMPWVVDFYRAAYNKAIEDAAEECALHADEEPVFKTYEDNYRDGWLDAAKECKWSISTLKMRP
jgi:hypothetical protein